MSHRFRSPGVQSIDHTEQHPFPYSARFLSNSRLKVYSDVTGMPMAGVELWEAREKQKHFAPKYRYQGTPAGCILTSAMDEIEQTGETAPSQVQVVCQGIRSGLGGGVVM